MKKLILAALLASFAAGATAADKINFGVSATYPPFESMDANNKIVGFDIDLSPLFSTPDEVAKQAVENDVHVIGVSSQAAGHKTLVPDLIAALKKQDAEDVIVVVGGVIPRQDYDFLYEAGVKGIFGPGTKIPVSARKVLDEINQVA